MKKRLQGTDLFTDSFIKHENQNYNQFLSEIENYKNKNSEWRTYIVQWVHQMKSPISSMRLALQNRKLNEENMQLLVELDQIDKQLNNILNLARLEAVDRDLKIEPINLSESMNRIINQNKRLFIQNKVFPKVQIENTSSTVLSDKKWLDFIIDQLVHNAIKFSNPTDQIIFNIKQIDTKCCLEISDTGVGIIKEDIPRIFDLYFTGKNGRTNNNSSGIGLYLVKQILEQLGHKIKVESEQSKGTKFTIYFD
ncbi:sensor histidine kinase [Finegoldia magna]|uniref:sensor histidine kinase n=1 Tax=Finegoldia magna TaxID=1260 RepID=UPI00399A58C6